MSGHILSKARDFALGLVLVCFALPAAAATVEYLHTDALGSIVAVTNSAGQVIERREYEPYGRQLKPAALVDGPGYTGHVSDAATGLDYMQHRYYDPAIGRFLSVDPTTASLKNGSNFNRYKYAANNPYRFIDPDGRTERCPRSTDPRCVSSIQVNGSSSIGQNSPLVGTPRTAKQQVSQQDRTSSGQGLAPAIPKPLEAPVANFRWINALLSRVALWSTVLSLSGDTYRPPTVVIGENMQGRVIPYATTFGLEYYRPVPAPESMWMANNMAWINNVMDQGKRIIDVGPSPWPRERYPNFPGPSSDFYIMELQQIEARGYPTYKINVDQ